MKKKLSFFVPLLLLFGVAISQKDKAVVTDRQLWLAHMEKLARPVLTNLAADSLKINMPVLLSVRSDNPGPRKAAAYLEAFARLFSGIAPWLNSEEGSLTEKALRAEYRSLVLKGLANAVNPAARDYMEWHRGGQPLVDASFMALGFLRCPWLWKNISDATKQQVIDAFLLTRKVRPPYNNWLLFSAIIEVFFLEHNYSWDEMRVDLALRQIDKWYVGDGHYSDGENFHLDYYNSYVIHPYLTQLLQTLTTKKQAYGWLLEKQGKRSSRYAVIQERMIASDGSFPVTGRSLVYRGAAFHHLADVAWHKALPAGLSPAQVRSALTAVIKKTTESPSTFTKEGWLNIGLYGLQTEIADVYNTTGSLYLCAAILLPLGLPEKDAFWSDPPELWTAKKAWSGLEISNDKALE
ncbi:MAG TPA: DUF2264 domain-containing protein [Flavisolibacter sp.]|nr:DUF2264 domain-containing protein [Flavisolibacter sp.]